MTKTVSLDDAINDADIKSIKERALASYVNQSPSWLGSEEFRFEIIVRATFDVLYAQGLIENKALMQKLYKGVKADG